MRQELGAESLRRICDPASFKCASTAEVGTLDTIIGQERAVQSLRFGLGIQEIGFHIFVSGIPGTGRTTGVNNFLQEIARHGPIPDDWCYVNNFQDAYRPHALRLPAGRARLLQAGMKKLVSGARQAIRSAFEGEEYAAHRQQAAQTFEDQRTAISGQISDLARQEGFVLQSTPMGLMTVPVRKGQPLSEEDFAALPSEDRDALVQKQSKLQAQIEAALRQSKRLERGAAEALEKLDQDVARYALSHLVQDLKEEFQDSPDVVAHLDQVQEHILGNLAPFQTDGEESATGDGSRPPAAEIEAPFRKYEVNVLVDNSGLKGAPVIMELNPTYTNLFGRIEQEAQFGALVTDFTLIRDGAMHRANGGYVVLPAEEVVRNDLAWETLKRAVASRLLVIEDAGEVSGFATTKSLRPEPIPLSIKAILIGTPALYDALREFDQQFGELFKVRADFDMEMERTDSALQDYASFVSTICSNEKLKHMDPTGLARLVEHGSRVVADQVKLTTHFGEIADIIREAGYYATQEGAQLVAASHVQQAIDQRYYRSSLIEERVHEMIERGTILIDVSGEAVGQVNGLSVLGVGEVSFGQPGRITCSVAVGREGVIDIEREARLGGPLHTKGVLILSGYLAERYAQEHPLSLAARLVFEQSYGGVEGDSASSAELYTLLSSLARLPIRQSIAVTGSVNQRGEIQPIGGVNEKIEGFFAVCAAKGLTGNQGVMIPQSNVANLMLKSQVVSAVREGRFHVWPVRTIDEGVEILTGVPAGDRQPDGSFPEGTVSYRVDARLREMADTLRRYSEAPARTG